MSKKKVLTFATLGIGVIAIIGALTGFGLTGGAKAKDEFAVAQPTPTEPPARSPSNGTQPAPPSSKGDPGTGDASAGDAGTGDAGTGDAGTGDAGTGDAGAGDAATGDAGARGAETSGAETSGAGILPDPNFEEELRGARFRTFGWKTDFSLHSVPFSEILSGGPPRDGIPPLDEPSFTTPEEADVWLRPLEPVVSVELNGDARAYPLQILIWHEIVNDVVGGVPVTVTFCPLCNSAISFDRRLDGVTYDFGTSGNLRKSDLVMWDRQTESWWQQFTGEAIVGELTGKTLTMLPSQIVSWEDFKAASPEGKVLSTETGFRRSYGRNPYVGYDRVDNPPFLFDGETDDRLQPKERVAAVSMGDDSVAFPFSILEDEAVVHYSIGEQELVVFFEPETRSALDIGSAQSGRKVGSTGIFDPDLDGQRLAFRAEGDGFVDTETGSVWNIQGKAIEGPLAGSVLTPIVHAVHFWFAWGAFMPDTMIYQGAN